jgi:Spy/CpxP family protein refolding chaperone
MPSMRSFCSCLGFVFVASVGVIACGGGAATKPPATSVASQEVDDESTANLMEHHRYHHHGGVTLFIAMSLDSLGVSPEQRVAVERVRRDLYARMEPARAAERDLVNTLADGLASGNIDPGDVNARVARVSVAAAAVHDATAASLNELHALLAPSQRNALIDKVESHWAVWQRANAPDTRAGNALDGRLAMLGTELDLTPSQVDKVRATLGAGGGTTQPLDPHDVTAHLNAMGEAFRSEKFDAQQFRAAGDANAHMAGWGAEQMANFVEAVSPVLTEDQRAKFAAMLREHATHNPSAQANP